MLAKAAFHALENKEGWNAEIAKVENKDPSADDSVAKVVQQDAEFLIMLYVLLYVLKDRFYAHGEGI
jgi:hypothetical protein